VREVVLEVDWSKIKDGRNSVKGMFPRVLKLPVIPDANEKLYELLEDGDTLLDVGANDRKTERFLSGKHKKVVYKSFDIDRRLRHDYYSIDDIQEKFDAIVMYEVIEHMSVVEAVEILHSLHSLLKDGGSIILSTPNVFHPTIFWRDCTHQTGFRYNELAGIMASIGFGRLRVYRVIKMSLKDRLTYLIYKPLIKFLNMDFCGRIVVTGEKT
jgi:SAM-dependent methyltransferase